MTVHLIKLCVGVESVDDLVGWIDVRLEEKRRAGLPPEHWHVTRMVPRRADELLDGGSLYWVIRGSIRARQRLIDIRPFTDGDGIGRCRLVMEPKVVETVWRPRRAFQGWRYLRTADAPPDRAIADGDDLPAEMRGELADLGIL